jgi:hypothetical protein
VFKSVVELKEHGPFSTFEEAFRDFMPRIKTMIREGCAMFVLETACWIEFQDEDAGVTTPALVHDAIDIAHHIGLLNEDGELQESHEDAPIEQVREEFTMVRHSQSASLLADLRSSLKSLEEIATEANEFLEVEEDGAQS